MLAPFNQASPARLLDALRSETNQLHVGLEKRLPFFSPVLNSAYYLRLIKAYHGFYRPLESALLASGLVPAELAVPERVKTPALLQDLRALGMTDQAMDSLAQCRHLPVIDSPGACLGVLYVLEGATLGGQILRREIHKRLGLDEYTGAAFLNVYGSATGMHWKAFLAFMDSVPADAATTEAAVLAAQSTFACFEHWLDGQEVLL
ncbi:biliverdin-producing heme oxygenase [Pseudomonas cichorii]|uniref:biliverdin-producing heme oxygenase n=1 Tax=Pseudomonas cichorii TaxID=36746 RepID=UPI001C880A8F|nr:biliverdin-producing heme oxygenase [Pseudomonas cichorii]MBX8522325.1 biliverdin-producing heme oxygenase [Pseudomonas cichorii]MBX8529273.1 biliverdin-producing heme oxygenase [Pseudomonas cichorii]MBX8551813.1 biliverdin-producing heme oxygenase [Pseudomonas cichorii]MBX8586870.1 biliverdin-producing heme oxygenase [Pseudomonas cichorii]MBX8597718.1 biliverdin-producing heme oxygenase [Pseudomonas cichorii]